MLEKSEFRINNYTDTLQRIKVQCKKHALIILESLMDDQSDSMNMHNSIGTSNASGTVAGQVLFMDSHDAPPRTNPHPPPSGYYQVATPKSPHELILDDQDVDLASQRDNFHDPNSRHGHDGDKRQDSLMGRLAGESEETERLKYETAKTEILEKLHLQTLISHKEAQGIQREIKRVDAQMTLLRKLHDDQELEKKVEEHTERQNDRVRRQLLEANTVANSSGYLADTSTFSSFAGFSSNPPLSAGSFIPTHHYHTRSKSSGNVTEVAHLRPANSTIIDMRLAGSKSIPTGTNQFHDLGPDVQSFRPNQMNMHHRRNYSSTCLTSNSGVVGKNEDNEAIFRRYDGILIIIKCSFCPRSGFTSAQGIVNHTRLKHGKTYSSQPLAVLHNQKLIEEKKQDPQVLEKFKELGKDPYKEYLPSEVAIPCSAPKSNQREPSPKQTNIKNKDAAGESQSPRLTNHLKKLYNKGDFEDLVEMVNDASKDLEVVLKQPSPESSESEEDDGKQETESESAAVSSVDPNTPSAESSSSKPESTQAPSTSPLEKSIGGTQETSSTASPLPAASGQRRSSRKRSNEQREIAKELQERARPAEKKARPDVLALTSVPEHDKRSSHYNLRAKSKLRNNSFH